MTGSSQSQLGPGIVVAATGAFSPGEGFVALYRRTTNVGDALRARKSRWVVFPEAWLGFRGKMFALCAVRPVLARAQAPDVRIMVAV